MEGPKSTCISMRSQQTLHLYVLFQAASPYCCNRNRSRNPSLSFCGKLKPFSVAAIAMPKHRIAYPDFSFFCLTRAISANSSFCEGERITHDTFSLGRGECQWIADIGLVS